MPQTETRRIIVKAVGRDLKQLDRAAAGIEKINNNTRNTSRVLSQFRSVFAGAFAFRGIQGITNTIDQINLLGARINAIEGDTEAGARAFNTLAQSASFTATSVQGLSNIYARLRLATQDLNISQEATIGLATALQQTFRIAGSTIAEATGASIQLSQGLASGQLRGQELRSVLEANAIFAKILADELDTTRGNLIKFAESGEITSEVVLRALARNFEAINEQASNIPLTIGQAITQGFNKLVVVAREIEKDYGVSGTIVKGIQAVTTNIEFLTTGIISLATAFVTSKLIVLTGSAVQGFLELAAVARVLGIGITSLIPVLVSGASATALLTGGLSVLAGAATFLALNWETVGPRVERVLIQLERAANDSLIGVAEAIETVVEAIPGLERLGTGPRLKIKALREDNVRLAESLIDVNKRIRATSQEANGFNVQTYSDALREGANATNNGNSAANRFQKQLQQINQEFRKTQDVNAYNRALRNLEIDEANRKFDEGKIRLRQLNETINDSPLQQLNKQFNDNTVSVDEYVIALNKIEFERLKRGADEGSVSVLNLNKALLETSNNFQPGSALFVGVSDYIQSAGTLSSNIAGAITNTFTRLEDSLVEFTQTGKFEFREFTRAILEDLNRIIIRQFIVRQLAAGIGQAIGPAPQVGAAVGATPPPVANAKGNAFNSNGIVPFANGGIVSRPTLFGFGSNQRGLMGEAGPEAILPLTRTSGGDLGVKATPTNVNINIINNSSDVEVEARETEDTFGNKQLDFIIKQKVAEGISNGSFDRTFKANFGLTRRGI